MSFPNIFTQEVAQNMSARINKLSANTPANWGKMDAGQMLAHCNVTYEMGIDGTIKKYNPFMQFMLKTFVKKALVGDKPTQKNSSTAPEMVIKTPKNFEIEKQRIQAYLQKGVKLGEAHFDGLEHPGFGKMTVQEWNTFYYKHLDHHLTQFGV